MNQLILKLPVSVKIALAPLLVMLCLLAVALQSYIGNSQTSTALEEISQTGLPRIAAAGNLKERAVQLNGMVMQSLAYEGAGLKADVIKALDTRIGEEFKALAATLQEQKKALGGKEPEAMARLVATEEALKKFERSALDTLDMKSAGLGTAASMMSTSESAYAELRKQMTAVVDTEMAQGAAAAAAVGKTVSVVNTGTLILAAVALLVSAGVTWYCNRLIVAPLGQAVAIAREVADGNLRYQEVEAGSDATGQVLRALGEVAQRLNSMIDNIRRGADQIDTAASEISIGNNDLATRTEQTASALQATASSVSDLAHTIQVNADTAVQANRLASDASQVAQQGGNDVAEVVKTMDGISTQARRISDIIGTIDGIAFQTNILALNAAVEAARAGEQGRGFAVVASEVRSLAQRSGEAAKEIRALISASLEQVEAGSTKVQAAGDTMRRIVTSIEQVSTMVAEISRATADQAEGIRGVNRAVSDMDKNTQQNAALVEQSAAAAESLRVQAEGLVRTISVFRVS
jgi:methyl-accepting chemotaxis protein